LSDAFLWLMFVIGLLTGGFVGYIWRWMEEGE
jgi:hypothetical protein